MSDAASWISVALGAAALGFTALGHIRRRGQSRLEYVVTMSRSILPGRVADDLEVTHHGVAITDPALSVVRIVNAGDRAIRPEDFETDLVVTFSATQELVSASWSATRPDDLRPGIKIDGSRVLVAPKVINPGEMLELQVLSSRRPSEVSVAGRIADLIVVRRKALPYPPGSGAEGEMLLFDRFMWFVFNPAFIIGLALLVGLGRPASDSDRLLIVAGTMLALAAYFTQSRYLVRRRRRWRP